MTLLLKYCYLLFFLGMPAALWALDLGAPRLTAPLQQEKFFSADRLSLQGGGAKAPLLEPQLGVSHDAREADTGPGMKQTTHRIHGEAGGKLNLFDEVQFSAVAKIPVYSYEVTGGANGADRTAGTEMLKNSGKLSWRSEMGISLGKGLDLNLFYDRSNLGRVERPGIEDREEKFGSRFIFRFK